MTLVGGRASRATTLHNMYVFMYVCMVTLYVVSHHITHQGHCDDGFFEAEWAGAEPGQLVFVNFVCVCVLAVDCDFRKLAGQTYSVCQFPSTPYSSLRRRALNQPPVKQAVSFVASDLLPHSTLYGSGRKKTRLLSLLPFFMAVLSLTPPCTHDTIQAVDYYG